MANILMLDRGVAFGPETPDTLPLGGAESAFAWLARALGARGHRVSVRNDTATATTAPGLDWAPRGTPVTGQPDLVIANRHWALFREAPVPTGRRVLWLHNRAGFLGRPGARLGLARFRPLLVVTSAYHRKTLPPFLPGCPVRTIPLAPAAIFREAAPAAAPPGSRAVFTSNPVRGLDRLLDLWTQGIRPVVPDAELHLFGGAELYRTGKQGRAAAITAQVLERARGLAGAGVVVHGPARRPDLAERLRATRVLLYPGSDEETYCLAAAEAQAMGVPAVLGDRGCLSERVVDGRTGFLVRDEPAFVAAAVRLLRDDALWTTHNRAALDLQRARGWDHVAADFEALL